MSDKPSVVLVHGGFVDGSGWQGVYKLLTADGYRVSVVQNPTLSLEGDAAAARLILDQQDGPTVLVGHSYGGAIITEAGNNAHVKNLVYVAALQPDAGASAGQLLASKPAATNYSVPSKDGFLTILPEHFQDAFAADLPKGEVAFIAMSQ